MKKELTFKSLIERVNLEGLVEEEKGESCYNLVNKLENKIREIFKEEGFEYGDIKVYSYANNIVIMNEYEMLDKSCKTNWKVVKFKISKNKTGDYYSNCFDYGAYYKFKAISFSEDNNIIKEDMTIREYIELVKEDKKKEQLAKDNKIEMLLNNVKGNKMNLKEFLILVDEYNSLDYNSKRKFRSIIEEN